MILVVFTPERSKGESIAGDAPLHRMVPHLLVLHLTCLLSSTTTKSLNRKMEVQISLLTGEGVMVFCITIVADS
jgi:hypothetical protein